MTFQSCVLSRFFLSHLLWLSVMQLRHYFFIGTLNPTLNRLARNDPDLGNLLLTSAECAVHKPLPPPLRHAATAADACAPAPSVSRYTDAFAVTQLCGVLCAPWNGLIMDRHRGKRRQPGNRLFQPCSVFCLAPHTLAPSAGETEQEADLRSSCLSLFITSLQGLLFSVCASIPFLPLQYLTFVFQVLNRSFLYGGNAAFISIA